MKPSKRKKQLKEVLKLEWKYFSVKRKTKFRSDYTMGKYIVLAEKFSRDGRYYNFFNKKYYKKRNKRKITR